MAKSSRKLVSSGDLTNQEKSLLEDCAVGVQAAAQRTIEGIIEIGTALNTARQILNGDREFGRWLNDRLPWLNCRTADRFMRVANRFASCSDKLAVQNDTRLERSVYMLLPSVLYEISSSSVPESVVEEVLGRASSGEKVTVKQAKELVRKAKEEAKGNVYQFPLATPDVEQGIAVQSEERQREPIQDIPSRLGISRNWSDHYCHSYYGLKQFYDQHLANEQDYLVSAAALVSAMPNHLLQADLSFMPKLVGYLSAVLSGLSSRGVA